MFNRRLRLVGCIASSVSLCFAFALLSACSRGASSPMTMKMSVSPDPVVGKDVTLHVDIVSKSAAPKTVLTVTLPSGVELVSGSLSWQGAVAANQLIGIDMTIRITAEGEWPVYAYAYYQFSPDSKAGFGASKTIYLLSKSNSAEVVEDINRETTPIPLIQGGPETLVAPTP